MPDRVHTVMPTDTYPPSRRTGIRHAHHRRSQCGTHSERTTPVPTVDLLYPRRRCPSTGDTRLLCPDLTRLVCRPADVAHDRALLTPRLAEAGGPHIAAPTG